MTRLGRILNALIIFLGARIIWQEWRHPARGGAGATEAGAGGAPSGAPLPNLEVGPPPAADAGGAEPSPADGGGSRPVGTAGVPSASETPAPGGVGAEEAAAADLGLGERQAVEAEARFGPTFPTVIGGAASPVPGGAPSGAGAEVGPTAEPGPGEAAAGADEAAAEVIWAGVPAAGVPTARDLDLATPSPPASGPSLPAGAVAGDGTPVCPEDHPIKGNASSMIYHQPGQPSYERTVAEYCFTSAEAAEAAGYRVPRR